MFFLLALLAGAKAQVNPDVDAVYQTLATAWNDLEYMENHYPTLFSENATFCFVAGYPCETGPDEISEDIDALLYDIVELHTIGWELRAAGNVGSYNYERVMTYDNGCELYINGYTAFEVDPKTSAIVSTTDYLDYDTLIEDIDSCDYLPWSSSELDVEATAETKAIAKRRAVSNVARALGIDMPQDSHKTLIESFYNKLVPIWSDLRQLTTIYPKLFTSDGTFYTVAGFPGMQGPATIAKGLSAFTANMTSVYSSLGELRIAGNIGSYQYSKYFTYKNGCQLEIDGYSAFEVDFSQGRLLYVIDYVDYATLAADMAVCMKN